MSSAMILAVALTLSPSDPQPAPELAIAATTRFAPSLEKTEPNSIAAHPDRPFAYAWSHDRLFVVDSASGEVDTISLAAIYGASFGSSGRVETAGSGASARLLLGPVNGHGAIEVFSIVEPSAPVHVRSIPAYQYAAFRVLPDGRSVVIADDTTASLVEIESGKSLGTFSKAGGPFTPFTRVIGAGGAPDSTVVALIEARHGYPYRLALHGVTPGTQPALLAAPELDGYPLGPLVDRRGEIVVVGFQPTSTGARYEVRDARDGSLLSVMTAPGRGGVATLAEGGGRRVLAVADKDGIDLFDLADPRFPVPLPRVTARIGYDGNGYVYSTALAPSFVDPWLFAASPGERAILAIDVRDGSIVGRSETGGVPPVAIAIGEAGGRRDAVALAYRQEFEEVLARGGRREIQIHDLAVVSSPRQVARIARSEPARIDGFVTVGADHAVAADSQSNAFALVSLREGRVVEVTGPDRLLGAADTIEPGGWLRSAGRFVLAFGGSWQEWAIVPGHLKQVAAGGDIRTSQYTAGDILPNGRVVLLGYSSGGWFLEVHDLDGRDGRLSLELGEFDSLVLSPDGRRAAIVHTSFPPEIGLLTVVDLADAAHPAVAWTRSFDVATARFDASGETILATSGFFSGWFTALRLDAGTGAPLGGESTPVDKFFYHGEGTTYGSREGWRAVFWAWTWSGFQTVLIDAGVSPPAVLRLYPEILDAIPLYAPRAGGGWYEILRNPWDDYADFLFANAGGDEHLVLRDPRDHVFPRASGRGYLATVANWNGPEPAIVLWRDTALARPRQVAVPGSTAPRLVAH